MTYLQRDLTESDLGPKKIKMATAVGAIINLQDHWALWLPYSVWWFVLECLNHLTVQVEGAYLKRV